MKKVADRFGTIIERAAVVKLLGQSAAINFEMLEPYLRAGYSPFQNLPDGPTIGASLTLTDDVIVMKNGERLRMSSGGGWAWAFTPIWLFNPGHFVSRSEHL